MSTSISTARQGTGTVEPAAIPQPRQRLPQPRAHRDVGLTGRRRRTSAPCPPPVDWRYALPQPRQPLSRQTVVPLPFVRPVRRSLRQGLLRRGRHRRPMLFERWVSLLSLRGHTVDVGLIVMGAVTGLLAVRSMQG
ncbi:MAG TPA: hypothetical protein VFR07_12805 [Mycobacteriales bacterium]|jgi:hypothetical protein|nr:hypothetical protein [Mycobacteriales bacterium]